MMNIKVTFDRSLLKKTYDLRKEIAQVTAGLVSEEFNVLLKSAPQRHGNYVANMALAVGTRVGRKGGKLYFPIRKDEVNWFKRGDMVAWFRAAEENKNILKNVYNHILTKAGWAAGIVIYNKLEYAEKVEGYTESQLREANAGGAHAMSNAKARLQIRINERIVYGSPEWHHLMSEGLKA